MNNSNWQTFFLTAIDVLGEGTILQSDSPCWCSWTTFDRLTDDAGYWTGGLPRKQHILETHIADSGVWRQPFGYSQLAHVVLPFQFYWQKVAVKEFASGYRQQDIGALSSALKKVGIPHRTTDMILEIKLY